MRILHCTHSVDTAGGGVIEAIKQLSAAHIRSGHQVEIASLDAPSDPWVTECPIMTHALGPGRTSYGYSRRFVPWLRARRNEYDAIIINGLWQYSGLGAWRGLRDTGTPYYVFPHGMLDPWFKRAYPHKHLKKALYWHWGESRVLRDARMVLFTSEEERRLARESFRPNWRHETVTSLGIASPSGDPVQQKALFLARFPELRDKRILLFFGRLHEKKGCDLLLRAFANLKAEWAGGSGEGSNIHLVMGGPCADPSYLAELKTIANFAAGGRETPITWTGMLSGDYKWGALHSADALVLPSHQENFGFSVVEALACQTPVLISDKVNIWREILDDRAGLVESDDFEGTVRLLRGWVDMAAEFRSAMRLSAARCFLSRFEIEVAAQNLLDLIQDASDPTVDGNCESELSSFHRKQ
jgi:glycosyltransferase involved in cell wall biosynthesis